MTLAQMGFRDMPAFRDANTWKWFMGLGEEDKDLYHDVLDYAKAPADEAWVYACVRVRYMAAMSVPLRVWVIDGRDRVPAEESGDEDALEYADLLDRINPSGEWNAGRFKAYLAAGNAVWGGNYVAKLRGRRGGRPKELWWLDLAHVRVDSVSGRQADNYHYDPPKGGTTDYDPADIIAFRNVNLEDPLSPLSPLSAARYDAATNRYAAQHTASTLRNDGVPKGAFVPQKGAIIEPSQKRSLVSVLRGLRGPKNAGKTPFLNAEIDWKPLALTPKDAEWIAARKASRMTVCAAMGVPLPLAGDWEGLSQYSVLRDAVRFMWHQTLIPDMDATADVLNDQLSPEFDPSRRRIRVGYDYREIEALGPTWENEVDRWLHAVEDQIVVPNQFLSRFEWGPPTPWGNQPVPRTQITLRPSDVTTAELASAIPALGDAAISSGTTADASPTTNDADTVRALGKALYKLPAVRAFTSGAPLDLRAILGHEPSAAVRAAIEAGLRSRLSAEQIAGRLGVREADATAAVLGLLAKQWPADKLDLVREGSWKFDPAVPLKKVAAARRPGGRNPEIVDAIEAQLAVGAPTAPAAYLKTDDGLYPIDGWHKTLAYDHAGKDEIPAYIGKGDDDWIEAMCEIADQIPAPETSAQKEKADRTARAIQDLAEAVRNQPAPVVKAPDVTVNPTPVRIDTAPFAQALRRLERPRTRVPEYDEAGNVTRVVERFEKE